MNNSEYVTYNGIQQDNIKPKSKLTIDKSLELQAWILDPSSRPYKDKDSSS